MEGYEKVGHFMAQYEQYAILRRFKALNYQILLYRQAEIMHLQEDLKELVEKDSAFADRKLYANDWWCLAHEDEGREQWQTAQELMKKLDEYNERLERQATLSKLEVPDETDVEFFKKWLGHVNGGNCPLRGLDGDAWKNSPSWDLVAVNPQKPGDTISRWVKDSLFPLFHRYIGEKYKTPEAPEFGKGFYYYEESCIFRATNILTTVMASLLPLVSITVLFAIESNTVKLGVVMLFSACFSLALALMTTARRIEVFAATAAFAAVNVVFLTSGPAVSN
ncbi:hypothetical protein M406DRAFT_325929 [Cryphonectria parasitica EP155]|uniref:DUF6594 domain-containing protein n=1 Tax=Cryphonectria parasitica (strain ATCC 38755 / EP155) TaxID=660469 RepID=A0A9P4YCE2_CRYP1|nr:uncharacterized protein M406DRAFT_325929 [Cryphonectria parasitica EP155]KAF3770485.1 hypothetical protein M406DRAFT_325929 [Cryphonectria parasitica EP155]